MKKVMSVWKWKKIAQVVIIDEEAWEPYKNGNKSITPQRSDGDYRLTTMFSWRQ
jgi:hypothetical protein